METRNRYIEHYCIKDENGKPLMTTTGEMRSFKFDDENAKIFLEKMKELSEKEYEINAKKLVFKLSEFPNGIFNGNDFINLDGLIDFIDEEEKAITSGGDAK